MNEKDLYIKSILRDFSIKSLLKIITQYKSGFYSAIVLYFIWLILELSIPILTRILIDEGLGYRDLDIIQIVVAAQFMFIIGSLLSDFFKMRILRNISVRINLKIMEAYFHKTLHKDITFFQTNNQATLSQHVNDNLRVEKMLNDGVSTLLNAVSKTILFTAILITLDTKISLLYIVTFIIIIVWDISFLKVKKQIDNARFQNSARIQGSLMEMVQGIYDIKTYRLQKELIKTWNGANSQLGHYRIKILDISQNNQGVISFINYLRDAIVLLIACYAITKGQMTLGSLLVIQYALGQMTKTVNDILMFVTEYQDAKLSLDRIKPIFSEEDPKIVSYGQGLAYQKGDIQVKDVNFEYSGSNKGLSGINLTIPYGSKVAIVGESGSGKSTLLKLLVGLLRPNSGDILVSELPRDFIYSTEWTDNTAVLLQESYVFNGDIKYNIGLDREESKIDYSRLMEAIKNACFKSVLDKLPENIHTSVANNAKNLSKGQVQRLLLARCFYKKANFMILDEPTSALDEQTAHEFMTNLHTYCHDKTLIMATHNLDFLKNMDIIISIKDGKILDITKNTHEERG
jgi:ATP-binding cassette, subfamily B, bacterial